MRARNENKNSNKLIPAPKKTGQGAWTKQKLNKETEKMSIEN